MVPRTPNEAALAAARAAESSGVFDLLEQSLGQRPDRLAVLTYHRVLPAGADPPPAAGTWSATPEDFASQIEFVARNYRFLSLEDVLEGLRRDRALPAKSVLLTFDDAYVDFEEHAWPILKQAGVPVVLFVPTAYPDHPERAFWWDRLYRSFIETKRARVETPFGKMACATGEERIRAFRIARDGVKDMTHVAGMLCVDRLCRELGNGHAAPKVLGWESLRSLAREGVILGAHSRTHPLLDRISIDEARDEIRGSMEDLRREVGSAWPVFAYPGGHYNGGVTRILDDLGVRIAFSTNPGVNNIHRTFRLRARRIQVGRQTNIALLRAQLLGIRRPS